MSQSTSAGKESKNKKKVLLIIIIAVLMVIVIALVGAVAYLLGRSSNQNTAEQMPANAVETNRGIVGESRMVLDEESAESVLDEMRKQVEEGMFECSMSTEWTFQDGTSESKDAYVANTSNNTHPIYFDVVLDGSDEVIYASPILPVDSKLTNFKLDKDLEPGTYEAICKYYLLQDMENQEVISSANFIITIKILN